MLNLKVDGHVCEMQIVHNDLLVARQGLPGHSVYNLVRNSSEVLEFLGVGAAESRTESLSKLLAAEQSAAPSADAAAADGADDAWQNSLAGRLVRAGCALESLLAANFAPSSLRCGGGFTVAQMRGAGVPLSRLLAAGYAAADFSAASLEDPGALLVAGSDYSASVCMRTRQHPFATACLGSRRALTLALACRSGRYDKIHHLYYLITPSARFTPPPHQVSDILEAFAIEPDSSAADRAAVVALWRSTGGGAGGWTASRNWGSSTEHPCDWFGLQLKDSTKRVVQLSLPSNGLAGRLPPALALLTHLKTLNLESNPMLIGEIPIDLTSLVKLTSLRLSKTGLVMPSTGLSIHSHGIDATRKGQKLTSSFLSRLAFVELSEFYVVKGTKLGGMLKWNQCCVSAVSVAKSIGIKKGWVLKAIDGVVLSDVVGLDVAISVTKERDQNETVAAAVLQSRIESWAAGSGRSTACLGPGAPKTRDELRLLFVGPAPWQYEHPRKPAPLSSLSSLATEQPGPARLRRRRSPPQPLLTCRQGQRIAL